MCQLTAPHSLKDYNLPRLHVCQARADLCINLCLHSSESDNGQDTTGHNPHSIGDKLLSMGRVKIGQATARQEQPDHKDASQTHLVLLPIVEHSSVPQVQGGRLKGKTKQSTG